MANIDKKYHSELEEIIREGYEYEDPNRKGVIRKEISDYKLKHDFKDGFPALTTKNLYWKGVVVELLWILRGDTNIKYLIDNGVNIWNKDAYNYYLNECKIHNVDPCEYEKFITFMKYGKSDKLHFIPSKTNYKLGDIGRGYGAQLRGFSSKETISSGFYNDIDQLHYLIDILKTNPMATKKTVTFWNPAEKNDCALTPCHWSFEALVEPLDQNQRRAYFNENYSKPLSEYAGGGYEIQSISHQTESRLNNANVPKYNFTLKWHQHSVDTFLGEPFNIASYGLLAYFLGVIANMQPKGIIGDFSNAHIYLPHMDKVKEQLGNDVNKHPNCELEIHPEFYIAVNAFNMKILTLDEFIHELRPDMFKLKGYESYPSIKAEMLAYNK